MGLGDDDWVACCPEMDGGLPCPRKPCEIEPGFEGGDVLDGRARVLAGDRTDCTAQYLAGARHACRIAASFGIRAALLKAKSPSCGCGAIYDGTHSRRLKPGRGVAAELLQRAGLEVFSEAELEQLRSRLARFEAAPENASVGVR